MTHLFLRTVRSFRVSFLATSAVAALVVSTFAACDGGLDGECCLAEPMCPDNAEEVDTCVTDQCFTVEACCTEKLCEPIANCDAAPVCNDGEVEVATCEGSAAPDCHSVSICGTTIFCESAPPCEAIPTCDEGDVEQPSSECPLDASCYAVELCGSTVFCLDNGLAHGCPETPPAQGEPCAIEVTCEYPVEGGCYDIWQCGAPALQAAPPPEPALQALEWQSVGTACPEGAN